MFKLPAFDPVGIAVMGFGVLAIEVVPPYGTEWRLG